MFRKLFGTKTRGIETTYQVLVNASPFNNKNGSRLEVRIYKRQNVLGRGRTSAGYVSIPRWCDSFSSGLHTNKGARSGISTVHMTSASAPSQVSCTTTRKHRTNLQIKKNHYCVAHRITASIPDTQQRGRQQKQSTSHTSEFVVVQEEMPQRGELAQVGRYGAAEVVVAQAQRLQRGQTAQLRHDVTWALAPLSRDRDGWLLW